MAIPGGRAGVPRREHPSIVMVAQFETCSDNSRHQFRACLGPFWIDPKETRAPLMDQMHRKRRRSATSCVNQHHIANTDWVEIQSFSMVSLRRRKFKHESCDPRAKCPKRNHGRSHSEPVSKTAPGQDHRATDHPKVLAGQPRSRVVSLHPPRVQQHDWTPVARVATAVGATQARAKKLPFKSSAPHPIAALLRRRNGRGIMDQRLIVNAVPQKH